MRFSFTTAIALPLSFGILPLSSLPLQFLESRIPRGEIGEKHIDGIIVLGGFTGNGLVAESHNQYGLNAAQKDLLPPWCWLASFHKRQSYSVDFPVS